jgi:mRNA turnover protein 4
LFRIYLGKNSIVQVAFGRTPEDEFKDNLRHVSHVSIAFSAVSALFPSHLSLALRGRAWHFVHKSIRRRSSKVTLCHSIKLRAPFPCSYFKNYESPEFAKAGEVPNEDVVIPAGPFLFPSSMLEQFRKLGLTVEIDAPNLILRDSFTAARKGEALTPEQAKVLTHIGKQLAVFRIQLLSTWCEGEFTELA